MLFLLPLKAENKKAPENLQLELNNLQYHFIDKRNFAETKLQESFVLLECFAALDGSLLPTSWDNLSVPSSRIKQ